MNKHNIVFISGLSIPKVLAKTKFLWNDKLWNDYNRIYISNYLPTSDIDAASKIEDLKKILAPLNNPVVIGHSLGAWWTANLACTQDCNIKKIILLTPLANPNIVPFFNTTSLLHPLNRKPVVHGPHKALVCHAKYDMLCPSLYNGERLIKHFNALNYSLSGGHFYQSDHTAALNFMRDWIDI